MEYSILDEKYGKRNIDEKHLLYLNLNIHFLCIFNFYQLNHKYHFWKKKIPIQKKYCFGF